MLLARVLRAPLALLALVTTTRAQPNCFAKPDNACDSLAWASTQNMTCCLVPNPASWMSKEEVAHCMGLGLGCPAKWSEWVEHGYAPGSEGFGDCYCDEPAGTCASGTIADMQAKCECDR